MRLRFKGEKKREKRQKEEIITVKQTSTTEWVHALTEKDCIGACVVFHNQDILCNPSETEKLIFQSTNQDRPTHVQQVFEFRILPGKSISNQRRWTIRASQGKYLSSPKDGVLLFCREAVGATEEWNLIRQNNCFLIESVWGSFMEFSNEEVKLSNTASEFLIMHQKVIEVDLNQPDVELSAKQIELEEMELSKRYQSWGLGKVRVQRDSESRRFKKQMSKQKVNLNESLLDFRARVKSDRYCK